MIGLGTLVFIWNWIVTFRQPATNLADPWDAFTLEWATTSPPPPENFDDDSGGAQPASAVGYEAS